MAEAGNAWVTKRGRKMRYAVRRRLIKVLADPDNDGLTKRALAKEVGISIRTMADYMTAQVEEEIRHARLGRVEVHDLLEVDRAMLEKARTGHVGAAKLIYARIAGLTVGEDGEALPSLEELEAEVARLRALRDKK